MQGCGRKANVAIKKLDHAYSEDKDKQRELEDAWLKEVQAHKEITKINHGNIISFMTAIIRDNERYLMFEWADGGNLREFWNKNEPSLSRPLIIDVIYQLRGLADALGEIHLKNYRHGDMKPQNILRVKTPRQDDPSEPDVGTLKICDMGLTKYHIMATQLRNEATNT